MERYSTPGVERRSILCYIISMVRKTPFINGEYYHVFNRGVNRRNIFLNTSDYKRFLDTIKYYSFSNHDLKFSRYLKISYDKQIEHFNNLENKLINIVAFVLMPNHFHFILRQTEENGISNFLRLFQNSYTKYFNTKHKRTGHLLQGQFKAVLVDNDSYLLHLSRYIHLNPLTSFIVKSISDLEVYPWSSYPSYLNQNTQFSSLVDIKIVSNQFDKAEDYRFFVNERSEYQQNLDLLKHLLLE